MSGSAATEPAYLPLASVCIPTFRRGELLRRALLSCLAQTLSDVEIIVSDDDAEESARPVVAALGSPRIHYFRNTEKPGWVGNTNHALAQARGRYIKILHDDDLLRPACLEKAVAVLEANPPVGVVSMPLEVIDEKDRPCAPVFYLVRPVPVLYRYARENRLLPRAEVLENYLTRFYPCCAPSGLVFRAEGFRKLGLFDPEAGAIHDLEMCMRFALEYDFYYFDEPLACWRCSRVSDTVHKSKTGQDLSRFYYLASKYAAESARRSGLSVPAAERLQAKALFFASKRCALNVIAGLQGGGWPLVRDAGRTLWLHDPYWFHGLTVPLALGWDFIRLILPRSAGDSPHHQVP